MMTETTPHFTARAYAAPLADALTAGLAVALLPLLTARFRQAGANLDTLLNGALLAAFYILFLVGLYWLRQLPGAPLPPAVARRGVAALGLLPLAAAFALAMADLTGYLDTLYTIDFGDMGNSYYYLATPAMYIFLGLLAFFLWIVPLSADRPAVDRALPALLLGNLVLIAAAAYLVAVLPTLLGEGGRVLRGGVIYALLLLLFSFPRLIYYLRTRQIVAFVTFDALLIALAVLAVLPR